MPLNTRSGYSGLFLPYEMKRKIVEKHCLGCGFLGVEEELDEEGKVILGCIYPYDVMGLNPYLREPYLTVVEIGSNWCELWNPVEPEKIDCEPGDWYDPVIHPQFSKETYARAS